jgi:hypothetical protein
MKEIIRIMLPSQDETAEHARARLLEQERRMQALARGVEVISRQLEDEQPHVQ